MPRLVAPVHAILRCLSLPVSGPLRYTICVPPLRFACPLLGATIPHLQRALQPPLAYSLVTTHWPPRRRPGGARITRRRPTSGSSLFDCEFVTR
uniref:Uncharacterized protein n=1 Tax=Setaria viridis TaxID=4556 RepID=A0A4U6VYU5_SETVI|nr:hypothetical protein SEVIR_2G305050v2 [Setaria viridis]